MAERALFLSIARRCASRGEDRRAIVTILNALRHQPRFIDTHPEALTLLAELMVPGFEAEVNCLQALYPSFGVRLFAEFDALGRDDIRRELAASFSAYCVERMKEAQCHDAGAMAEVNPPWASYATMPCVRTTPKDTSHVLQDAASVAGIFDTSPTLSNAFLDPAALTASGQRRAMSRSTRSETGRRFERLCPDKCTPAAEATFADDPTQRIILDFDKRLPAATRRSLWQASCLTPYRTFTEELKDFREATTSSQTHASISRSASPLEAVAETTYTLTDTPSIAPYATRHPLRFSVRGLPLALSVIVCALLAFGAIAWHTADAKFEHYTVRGIEEGRLADKNSGHQDPVSIAEADQLQRDQQETLIESYLSMGAAQHAMQVYADLDLPQGHPFGEKIRRRLLKQATQTGDWSIVANLFNLNASGMNYLEAARYIDLKQANVSDHWGSTMLMIEHKKPNPESSTPYLDALNMAYHAAYAGSFTHALNLVRDLRSLHPAHWEPIFLQAMILSQMGEGLEAAKILESRLSANDATAPLIVLANLYRARAGLPLHLSWIILPYFRFADPALEGARCEVFWRQTLSVWAAPCLSNAAQQPHVAKNTWWMLHDKTLSKRTSAEISKAGSGAMSMFGYHLIWAQRRMAEGAIQEAAEGYKRAITFDPTTSTPDVVAALARLYLDRNRRYEGSRFFDQFAKAMPSMTLSNEVQGTIHYWAAILYNPAAAHPMVLSHLAKAKDKLGETRPILKALIQYYDKKEKPLQARKWKQRLAQLEDPS